MSRRRRVLAAVVLASAVVASTAACDPVGSDGMDHRERETHRYRLCLDAGGSYEKFDGGEFRCTVPGEEL